MKIAEEWCEEMFGKNNWVYADTTTIRAIQLDAMKEGMRRAASIADKTTVEYWTGLSTQTKHREPKQIVQAILTAAEQLT